MAWYSSLHQFTWNFINTKGLICSKTIMMEPLIAIASSSLIIQQLVIYTVFQWKRLAMVIYRPCEFQFDCLIYWYPWQGSEPTTYIKRECTIEV